MRYWNKIHICGALSLRYGLTRYLEITTTETGGRYREAQEIGFAQCMRLVYKYDGHDIDGLPVDFSSPSEDISAALKEIVHRGLVFDIILVDAHHTFECTKRDLEAAFALLAPGGAIVAHDCFPADETVASPEYHPGEWCGVSYKAYIDFVLGNPGINYLTLDTDYGCGIIFKPRTPLRWAMNIARAVRSRRLVAQWRALGSDYSACFAMMRKQPAALLRLGNFATLRHAMK